MAPRPARYADVRCQAGFSLGLGKNKPKKPVESKNGKGSCHCGSGNSYHDCCKPLHNGERSATRAAGPEGVLRARYSALVRGELRYLLKTTAADNPARAGSSRAAPGADEVAGSGGGGERSAAGAEAAGSGRHCSLKEDLVVTMASIKLQGLKLLGSCSPAESAGGASSLDYEYRFRRVIDEAGRQVAEADAPMQWRRERARFVVGDEGEWQLLGVEALDGGLEGAAAAVAGSGAAAAAAS